MSTTARVTPYDGMVLAGGRARRMGGTDKTSLVVDGRTLLDVALDALTGAGRLVVVGRGAALPGVERVIEDPPRGGPVAALAAGLRVVSALCVVLAADLPFVNGAHVAALVTGLQEAVACLAVDGDGRDQPLLAAYATDALRRALPPEPHGASMRSLLAGLAEQGEVRRTALAGDPPPWFDCDTPADLAAAQERPPR